MGRCVARHRFKVLVCVGAWICAVLCGVVEAGAPASSLSSLSSKPRSSWASLAGRYSSAQEAGKTADSTSASASQRSRAAEYTLSQRRYDRARAYSRASYILYFVSVGVVIVTLILILRLGIAARFRDWAERVSDVRRVQALIFVPLLVLAVDVAELPVGAYGHFLSRRFEMSVQSWGSWLLDWAKEQVLMIGLALLLALMLSAILRKSPRRWWLYFWLASLPVSACLVFITPWFRDPLFNRFTPLRASQPELVAKIEKLTEHAGAPIPTERMFLMNASKKTNAVDAYVTGLGASKRIVVYDTTIQKATTDETLFIVGHELGHYVLGHVWKGWVFFAALLLIGLYLLFRALHWALGRWGAEWRIYGPEDWASFAVLLLFVYIGMFLSSPIANGFSRMQEHAADVYGLEVIHGMVPDSAGVAARSFQVLGEEDLADPNPPPLMVFWLYSHAPLGERLAFAENYDPWGNGESPEYVK